MTEPAGWHTGLTEGTQSLFEGRPSPADVATYATLTYEVTGRIARITSDRPERGAWPAAPTSPC